MRRGLVPSRDAAREAILAGHVLVGGATADEPARLVGAGEPVVVIGGGPRFVSRGGEKLEAALQGFDVPVVGRRALDAGASTGGFTDCLLQRGVAHVIALDVGRGQLHPRLRDDERVTVLEGVNVRTVSHETLGSFDLVCADLAFISLRTVAPALVGVTVAGGDLILLIKPQFEAGRVEASRGKGVIRDHAVWTRAIEAVRTTYAGLDAVMMGLMPSPITGARGNVEFLAHLRVHPEAEPEIDVEAMVASVPETMG